MNLFRLVKLYSLSVPFFIMQPTCHNNDNGSDSNKWSDKKLQGWYAESPWSHALPLTPDSSINTRLLAEQISRNPQSWEAAFKFIKENDFNTMQPGRYELSADGTHANIAEYQNKISSRFEAHRKFIDIQMVSKGKEYVLITSLDMEGRQQLKPYDEKDDIEFFAKDKSTRRLLTPGNFMIFFPSDAHQPGLMVDSVGTVRKIVIKVRYVPAS